MVWLAKDEPRPELLKTGFLSRRECSPISSKLRGLLLTSCPTKLQSLPHITQLQFYHNFFFIFSQQYGLHVDLKSSCIKTMQLLTKLASHWRTLMTMLSVWWNIHHNHPTCLRAISGSVQKSSQPLLLKLCIHTCYRVPRRLLEFGMRMQRCIEVEGSYFEGMWLYFLKLQVNHGRYRLSDSTSWSALVCFGFSSVWHSNVTGFQSLGSALIDWHVGWKNPKPTFRYLVLFLRILSRSRALWISSYCRLSASKPLAFLFHFQTEPGRSRSVVHRAGIFARCFCCEHVGVFLPMDARRCFPSFNCLAYFLFAHVYFRAFLVGYLPQYLLTLL